MGAGRPKFYQFQYRPRYSYPTILFTKGLYCTVLPPKQNMADTRQTDVANKNLEVGEMNPNNVRISWMQERQPAMGKCGGVMHS